MSEGLESICRVCLSFEGNFYPLQHGLHHLLLQLTGFQLKADARLPSYLCDKCSNELRSFQQFQLTCKQSNHLLDEVLTRFHCITKEFIETVRRENSNISREIKIEDTLTKSETVTFIQDEFKIEFDNSESDTDFGEIFTQSSFSTVTENETTTRIRNSRPQLVPAAATRIDETDFDATQIDAEKKKRSQPIQKKAAKQKVTKVDAIAKTKPLRLKKDVQPNKIGKIKTVAVKKAEELVKSYFDTKYLTYEEQICNLKKRQKSDNYILAPYKCDKCYTGFFSESSFDNHMVRHTDTWGRYQCDICKVRFKCKKIMTRHIGYGSHNQQFTCKKCDFVTAHKSTAILHAQWHQGTSYQCQHCDQLFTRLTSYNNHQRVKHASEFACALCGHNFVTEKGLNQHKNRQHRLNSEMSVDGPTCTTCDIKFVSDDALSTHLRVSPKHVTENTIWSSNFTYKRGKPVTTVNKYKWNFKKKVDLGELSCEQCGLAMANARAYFVHFRKSHPDKTRTHYPTIRTPSMCDVCGRIFQSITHLNHHITQHTGEKPYKCDQCNKRFPNKVYLDMHKKRHVDKLANVTFDCPMCEKNFTLACNRNKHIRMVHSDARPFSCDICGKAFKSKYEKKTHIDYVHYKKPWPKRQRHKEPAAVRVSEIDDELQQLF